MVRPNSGDEAPMVRDLLLPVSQEQMPLHHLAQPDVRFLGASSGAIIVTLPLVIQGLLLADLFVVDKSHHFIRVFSFQVPAHIIPCGLKLLQLLAVHHNAL